METKNKKKNEGLYSPVKARQVELLKKYYVVNEEEKTVDIKLGYDSTDNLFTDDYASDDHPEVSHDIVERVSDIIGRVPADYKANIKLQIDDLEEHSPETVLESFNDAIEFSHYSVHKETKHKWVQIALLIIAGLLFLIFMNVGDACGWFGDSEDSLTKTIVEFIDIAGTVFLWEAVTIIFLSPSEEKLRTLRFKKRVNSISILDKEGNTLICEDSSTTFGRWAEETLLSKISKYCLLIAGAGYICVGGSSLIYGIKMLTCGELQNDSNLVITIISALIGAALMIFVGIAAISDYTGRGRFHKFISVFAILWLVVGIFDIAYAIYFCVTNNNLDARTLSAGIGSSIFSITLVVGWLCGLKNNKRIEQ